MAAQLWSGESGLSQAETHRLRQTFNGDPEIYDKGRRGYPEPLFVNLLQQLGKRSLSDTRVLEIAPGTGQATKALLELGAQVTAVELGGNLAVFLRRKFTTSSLEVLTGSFEETKLPLGTYDLIVCATAWHWLDKNIRFHKAHALLRPQGQLAIISTNQVASPADRGFFSRVNDIYERWGAPKKIILPDRANVRGDEAGMIASHRFDDIEVYRYDHDQTYTTSEYIALVKSYSGTLAMESGARQSFLAEVERLIDTEFNGQVIRPLVVTLTLGRRNH